VLVIVFDLLMTLSFVLEDRTVPRKAIQETLPRPTLVLSSTLSRMSFLMTLEIVIGLHWQETDCSVRFWSFHLAVSSLRFNQIRTQLAQ